METPKAILVNFSKSPFEREVEEVAENIPLGFTVVRVFDTVTAQ